MTRSGTGRGGARLRSRALLALALLAAVPEAGAARPHRPLGDSAVVAQLPPAPGYPEGIAVHGGRVYVATAARFGQSLVPPYDDPEVQAFDAESGELVARYRVVDAVPDRDHGLSGLAFDAAGRLYVLDTQWGVLRFDPRTAPPTIDPGADPSYVYATAFPDLDAGPPALPNDLAFDKRGVAYVTDSLQGLVWRIDPPAAGTAATPQPWARDARLGGAFGANGIRLGPRGDVLYVAVSADLTGRGHVYRLGLDGVLDPVPVHTYLLGEVPDNLAFGRSGRLYVALAGSNQIQVLAPDGREVVRYGGPARHADGTTVPYDMPSGVALDTARGALLVNNHSEVLGLPRHFVVFDVYVDDRAEPLVRPRID